MEYKRVPPNFQLLSDAKLLLLWICEFVVGQVLEEFILALLLFDLARKDL